MSGRSIWVMDEPGWDGRLVTDEKPPDPGYSEYRLSSEDENTKLRAALDAADRFAKMVKQYAEGSIVTLGDIGQEYEFYQAARAAVEKAGGDEI